VLWERLRSLSGSSRTTDRVNPSAWFRQLGTVADDRLKCTRAGRMTSGGSQCGEMSGRGSVLFSSLDLTHVLREISILPEWGSNIEMLSKFLWALP